MTEKVDFDMSAILLRVGVGVGMGGWGGGVLMFRSFIHQLRIFVYLAVMFNMFSDYFHIWQISPWVAATPIK